jgi:hypothetical protein
MVEMDTEGGGGGERRGVRWGKRKGFQSTCWRELFSKMGEQGTAGGAACFLLGGVIEGHSYNGNNICQLLPLCLIQEWILCKNFLASSTS